jgi:hypothetical protein
MKWKSHHLHDCGDSFGSDSDIAKNREQANAL